MMLHWRKSRCRADAKSVLSGFVCAQKQASQIRRLCSWRARHANFTEPFQLCPPPSGDPTATVRVRSEKIALHGVHDLAPSAASGAELHTAVSVLLHPSAGSLSDGHPEWWTKRSSTTSSSSVRGSFKWNTSSKVSRNSAALSSVRRCVAPSEWCVVTVLFRRE
jgi:hypothetical protein